MGFVISRQFERSLLAEADICDTKSEPTHITRGRTMKKLVILLAFFYCGASFGQSEIEIFAEVSVVCVSNLAMASILTEAELSKMVFTRDAKWWRSILLNVVGAAEADRRIESEMKDIKTKWNNEELSWDQLLDVGQKCSEMKLDLESPDD